MAVPAFVPVAPDHHPRDYESAPWRQEPWLVDRPGDFARGPLQPDVDSGRVGAPGPDQGYAIKLARLLAPSLHLSEGEDPRDAEVVIVHTGLKRASTFGRAPIMHDLRVAATLWGLLDPQAPEDLVDMRKRLFEGLHLTLHHYPELRAVVDLAPAESLALTPEQAADDHARDWRSLLKTA